MAYNLGQTDPEERTELYADPREEEYVPRPRRMLRVAAALIVMGVFAGGLWFAYVEGVRHVGPANGGDIPLIRADTRPMKIKPENPGGMQIPDRDMLIYGEQRPQVEHLLPPPEQPMARPAPPPPPPSPPIPQPQVQREATAGPAALPASSPAAAAEAGSPAPATAPVSPAAAEPPLSPAAAAAARELAPMPATNPATPGAARGAAGKGGGLKLQLGAVRSETEARANWERLKHQNADLLGKLSAVAIRADLGDKGVYYRIQAGPVADPSTADRICGGLRQRRLPCIIVR
jgi:cell division septation protein DedD